MTEIDPVKASWQAMAGDGALPSMEQVRSQADAFHRKIRRRNAVEYGAAVVVIIVFSGYALFLHGPLVRLGSALVVLGTFIMLWQFRRRATSIAAPEQAGLHSIIAHQRAQLVRQRDAVSHVFSWYLLPFVPGLAVMMTGTMVGQGFARRPPTLVGSIASLVLVVIVFVGVWWLNQRAARKLQKAIDAIDALSGGEG